MTYNAGNRKDVRRLEKQARQDEIARHDTIRGIMASSGGREWVHDRLSTCHIFASSFSLEPLEMAFREGERNHGLQLLNDVMQSCPDQYVQMMREANVRHIAADAASRNDGGDTEDSGRDDSGSDSASDPDDAYAARH